MTNNKGPYLSFTFKFISFTILQLFDLLFLRHRLLTNAFTLIFLFRAYAWSCHVIFLLSPWFWSTSIVHKRPKVPPKKSWSESEVTDWWHLLVKFSLMTLTIPSPQCCAVAFIEKLDGQSLNLSSEEFELYMSGQASPHWQQAPGPSSCSPGSAALNHVHKRLDLLTGLGERQERVMEKARQLESDLIDWTDEVEQKVQSVVESFPPETQNPTASGTTSAASSAIDADNTENELLPPPLQPQVFAGWCEELFSLKKKQNKTTTPRGFTPPSFFPLLFNCLYAHTTAVCSFEYGSFQLQPSILYIVLKALKLHWWKS